MSAAKKILRVLLPPRTQLGRDQERLPALELILACGNQMCALDAEFGIEFHPRPASIAAITRQQDCVDARDSLWLRADPAWLQAEISSARLMRVGQMNLTEEDCRVVEKKLRPLFGDSGFEFSAPNTERWYVRAPKDARLPNFSSPHLALGDYIDAHLPSGDNMNRWRALQNEAQIILHNLALNTKRFEARLPPLNSLWFHGAGVLPEWVRTPYQATITNDAVLRSLLEFTQCKIDSVENIAKVLEYKFELGLLDLRQVTDSQTLHLQWAFPLLEAVKARQLDEIILNLEGENEVSFRSGHRWRFWRTAKPLYA